MEFGTGAMGTLLPKLGELLLVEYGLKKSVKQGIEDLRDELLIMQATLVKLSDVPRDELDPLVKIWADDIRELSYAIEDSLDSYIVSVAGANAGHTFMGFIRKTRDKVSKLKIRHRLADEINDINSRVRKVKERHDRYKVHDIVADRTTTTVDPRLSAMYSKVTDLVGIDGAIAELTMRLSEGDGEDAKKLKAVSVVGFGGLGKTTLAKAVYDKLYKKIGCGGFVSVGQNPDVKKVLRDILYELDKKKHENITESNKDERQLIDKVQEYLADKRYLIVIDDIWDIPTWNRIKRALVDNSHGSRIMTTTRICEVAKSVGSVYNINPLSNVSSKELFWTRICGGEGISLDRLRLPEVSDKILRKCGGVPLSIITIASLLAGKQREDWCKVYDSIGFGKEENEAVQNTRKILAFSYYDLPSNLKTCLLYLSLYPEDWNIRKESLIWMWIAEGIIPDKPGGTGLFKLGESYLNDLINRSMIQLIEPSYELDKFTCRVHDMVLDLIRNLSSELNFVTIHDKSQDHNTCLPSCRQSTRVVRRLALHKTSVVEHSSPSMENEQMRSFIAMMCHGSRIPQILSFRVLRVLVLEQCRSGFSARGYRLEHLGKLVQLRYLSLANTPVVELPRGVGYDLKFLQTLDVRGSGIKELPPSVGEMGKLMCLRASLGTRMMGGVGKLTSLEHLELGKSPNFASELGKLTEMRVLRIVFDKMDESMDKSLLESMRNLRRIEELDITIHTNKRVVLQGWEDWAPPSELREFVLDSYITLPRQPSWIDFSCTPRLSSLELTVEVLEARCVQALGKLPSLRYLTLFTEDYDKNRISYTVGSDEFQKLVHLETNVEITCAEGALPLLEELICRTSVGGFWLARSMPLVQRVSLYVDCKGCHVRSKAVRSLEASLEHAAEIHPNRPTLEKEIINYTGTEDEDEDEYEVSTENEDEDEEEEEEKEEEEEEEEEEPTVSKP